MKTPIHKRFLGPILGVTSILSIGIGYSLFMGTDLLFGILTYGQLSLMMMLIFFLPGPYNALGYCFILIVSAILKERYKKHWVSILIFFFSVSLSGIYWLPSPFLYPPGVAIDYVLFFFLLIPGSTMMFSLFSPVRSSFPFLMSEITLVIFAFIALEFVNRVVERRIPSHQAAGFLFLVVVLWCFLPACILLFSPYVLGAAPFPTGPVLSLFLLPFIDERILRRDTVR